MKKLLFLTLFFITAITSTQAGFLSYSTSNTYYYQCGNFTQQLEVLNGTALKWGVFDLELDGPVPGTSYIKYVYWNSMGQQFQLFLSVDYSNLIVGNMKFIRRDGVPSGDSGYVPAPSYNGGGSSNNGGGSTYTTCRICGGTGKCTSCHGDGGHYADTGYYTGSGNRSWISCPSCNGSTRCFNCHGSGKQ